MELPQRIKQYYFDNISLLPEDKKFHFASRMAAWEGDAKAFKLLSRLKTYMVPNDSEAGLHQLLEDIIAQPQKGRRNAHDLRKPYFAKYPQLYGAHLALFRVRHLQFVYGIDARKALFSCINQTNLDKLAKDLMKDEPAVRILSTFAVNYLYLYKGVVLGNLAEVDPEFFINVSREYDLNDEKQLQLLIYLFTHCIIGETNFYADKISEPRLSIYRRMIETLETVIRENFKNVNLDNKLEFLVCCRICGAHSALFEPIYAECEKSISSDGLFLVDRHNLNPQSDRSSFQSSEHRNVLFIMSSSNYEPHPPLLTD